jgi:hypothetical protein
LQQVENASVALLGFINRSWSRLGRSVRRVIERPSEDPGWRRDRDRAKAFDELHAETVRLLCAANNETWHINAFLPEHYPDLNAATDALQWLTARHLLREAGDAQGAARVFEGLVGKVGAAETKAVKFCRRLSRFVADELAQRYPEAQPPGKGIALALVVWGADYIDLARQYCFASLAAPGNVPAVTARGPVRQLICTRESDYPQVAAAALSGHGIAISTRKIPDQLTIALSDSEDARYGELKYWLLGGLQSLMLFDAAGRGEDLFTVFPDVVYSSEYLSGVARLLDDGNDAVLLSAFAASRTRLEAALSDRAGGSISAISAPHLALSARRCIEPYFESLFFDIEDRSLPDHVAVFFDCGDHIRVHSAHYNMAAVANSAIARLPARFFFTLDSELVKILSHSRVHVHDLQVDYFATEVTGRGHSMHPVRRLSEQDYIAVVGPRFTPQHLALFRRAYRAPLAANAAIHRPSMATCEVDQLIARVADKIESGVVAERTKNFAIVEEAKRRAGVVSRA